MILQVIAKSFLKLNQQKERAPKQREHGKKLALKQAKHKEVFKNNKLKFKVDVGAAAQG